MTESGRMEKKKVMVAIDESELSLYAFEWAIDNLGDTISNSELVVFTAQPIIHNYGSRNPHFYFSYKPITFKYTRHDIVEKVPELTAAVQENQKKVSLIILEKARALCAKHGFVVPETVTEVGDPKLAICEAVQKFNIDLLVLGSHGRGAITRAFLGSVSNYCVNNAKCPVLVVRKPS